MCSPDVNTDSKGSFEWMGLPCKKEKKTDNQATPNYRQVSAHGAEIAALSAEPHRWWPTHTSPFYISHTADQPTAIHGALPKGCAFISGTLVVLSWLDIKLSGG